jgi:hypothetical protein
MFISVLKAFFVQMWQSSVDVSRRIDEIRTGVPIGETLVIKDGEEAWSRLTRILESAKEDIVVITSSQSINNLAENDPVAKYFKKGLNVRIMASIDLDNLGPAQKLSKKYEVKHVPISYMTMMMVDNKHLFMFKLPPLSDFGPESAFYLPDTFYSNDLGQIERVSEMLNDIWKRGIDISEIRSQAGTKLPNIEVATTETIAGAVEKLLTHNVTSVLITESQQPIGVVNERELLREIVSEHKDPLKTLAKEVMFTPLIFLKENESMVTGMKYMREKGFKRATLVKNGQLVGMLTEESKERS